MGWAAGVQDAGGVARVARFTAANGNPVTTTGRAMFSPALTQDKALRTRYIQISNTGGNILRVYFTHAAFTTNTTDGFLELAATTGYFEGPVDLDDGDTPIQPYLWLRSVTGNTDAVVVFYNRRP